MKRFTQEEFQKLKAAGFNFSRYEFFDFQKKKLEDGLNLYAGTFFFDNKENLVLLDKAREIFKNLFGPEYRVCALCGYKDYFYYHVQYWDMEVIQEWYEKKINSGKSTYRSGDIEDECKTF